MVLVSCFSSWPFLRFSVCPPLYWCLARLIQTRPIPAINKPWISTSERNRSWRRRMQPAPRLRSPNVHRNTSWRYRGSSRHWTHWPSKRICCRPWGEKRFTSSSHKTSLVSAFNRKALAWMWLNDFKWGVAWQAGTSPKVPRWFISTLCHFFFFFFKFNDNEAESQSSSSFVASRSPSPFLSLITSCDIRLNHREVWKRWVSLSYSLKPHWIEPRVIRVVRLHKLLHCHG